MKDIGKRIRVSEKNPPIMAPLIDILKYNGKIPFGDQLLLGTAPDLSSLQDHINSFLKQIRAIRGRLPTPTTPITKQEYTEEVNRLREATSSGPYDTTTSMVQMEAFNSELREIGRLRFNSPW